MKKEVIDYWFNQASVREDDEIDALRKVLDPEDKKGVKNTYLDAYLKHYIREYLCPRTTDILLEVGCGIGRLSEYLSPLVKEVCGIDIVDMFVDRCNADPHKKRNTFYLKMSEMEKLKDARVNKIYIVWALMYVTDKVELIKTLIDYRNLLPYLKEAVVIEQVKLTSHAETRDGKVGCAYRSIEEYMDIFMAAGFNVKDYIVMGERYNAPFYKLLHVMCNMLPKRTAGIGGKLFYLDKRYMGANSNRLEYVNNIKATDILFRLEIA